MPSDDKPLAGRVALVTCASRGIGNAVALSLARAGAHLIATARTQGALEELDDTVRGETGEAATLVPMDLCAPDGIDRLGLAIFERHRRLDILVHAAGMLGGLRPLAHVPPALWDKLLAVNLTSAYRLIRSLEPLLRASDAGRAVFLSCEQARSAQPFWGAYAATKAGMEAMVRSWADEIDNSPVRALIVDPGPARTALRLQAFPGEDRERLTDPAAIGPMIVDLLASADDPGLPAKTLRFSDWREGERGPSPGRAEGASRPLPEGEED
ncbi:MAG: SDR family NAD(P)-dependent oxidoreductase [Caulobacteraceae bacterium]